MFQRNVFLAAAVSADTACLGLYASNAFLGVVLVVFIVVVLCVLLIVAYEFRVVYIVVE